MAVVSTARSDRMSPAPAKRWGVGLWVAQIVLAALLALAGGMKSFLAPQALPAMGVNWAVDVPVWLLRFIGISELAAAIGLVLPALTRIKPGLTPLAAACFLVLQLLAIGFHWMRAETMQTIGLNLMFVALSVLVVWGRVYKLPITPRP